MSILLAIIIGILVGGAIGYLLVNSVDHLLMNSLFGMAGSIFGLVLAWASGVFNDSSALFNARATLASILCAAIFVLVFNGIQKVLPKAVNSVAPEKTEDPNE
jgi:hypothetical protein